jgi:5-methylcytosine-specific restriction endonuclease McrA
MFQITEDWLHENKTENGGWNNSQLVMIGENWPPQRGWIKKAIGRQITDECARLFEQYGREAPSKTERKKIRAQAKERQKPRKYVEYKKGRATVVGRYAGGINVASDDFLQSYEWRRVRMEALKKYGRTCQCCGASPATGAVMNVDHIKPRRLFPQLALDLDNLQVLCHECNHGKGNWDMTDWRPDELTDADRQNIAHLRSI